MNGTLSIDKPGGMMSSRVVQFELYDFGFKMQESSDFEIPDFLIPDSRFPIPLRQTPGIS